jgi:hypothetical protein
MFKFSLNQPHEKYIAFLYIVTQFPHPPHFFTPRVPAGPPPSPAKTCILSPFGWMLLTQLRASKAKLGSEQVKLQQFNLT